MDSGSNDLHHGPVWGTRSSAPARRRRHTTLERNGLYVVAVHHHHKPALLLCCMSQPNPTNHVHVQCFLHCRQLFAVAPPVNGWLSCKRQYKCTCGLGYRLQQRVGGWCLSGKDTTGKLNLLLIFGRRRRNRSLGWVVARQTMRQSSSAAHGATMMTWMKIVSRRESSQDDRPTLKQSAHTLYHYIIWWGGRSVGIVQDVIMSPRERSLYCDLTSLTFRR